MTLKIKQGQWFVSIISILCLTDIAILLDILFLRQVIGFLFLTILPGLLILQILKLNKIASTERFVLSVGLSVSFLMLLGLLINNLSLSLGYKTPLSTIPLLISFNIAFIVLAIIGYKINKNSVYYLPSLNLSTSEKAFLIVSIFFPALSVFGIHVMNTTNNNIILMFMFFVIPIYVAFVCFFNQKFSKRFYPIVIFLISISLLLLLALRSDHIIGIDIHKEYYFFQTTLNDLHWGILYYSTLNACLSISLLPTIYQSILDTNPEFLFKILYSSIFSIFPLAIYILSKKYVGEFYGFLASCFSMFQTYFLWIGHNPRTSVAVLFFALAMMVLVNDKIDHLKKRMLFLIFMTSCIVSHYSTTYIFFLIMLVAFVEMEILLRRYTFKKVINLTIVAMFFTMIVFWYSQVTEAAFDSGVIFIKETLSGLNKFFIEESRSTSSSMLLGKGIMHRSVAHKMEFVFTWLMFAFIGIGLITLLRRHKNMSFPELTFERSIFLREKFEVEYLVIALACAGLLVAMITLPYISIGYDIMRLYAVTVTILSVFFVIGGITVTRVLNQIIVAFHWRGLKKNDLKVRAYQIILIVLIPYFFCVTDVTYNMAGVSRSILLNSEGEFYDRLYIHDQESYAAKWLKKYIDEKAEIYGDQYSNMRLTSQGGILSLIYAKSLIEDNESIEKGYIYLRYTGVVDKKLMDADFQWHNMTEYRHYFIEKNKIYNNGGSEIYR